MSRESPSTEDDEQTTGSGVRTSRRRFLEVAGAAGVASGIGGFAMAQDGAATTFEFGGRISGWQGRAPSEIEGEVNPTLNLEAGTEYEVVWENIDGAPHNFAILDGEGNVVLRTELISEEGATQSTTFTASEEMTTYYCQAHPTSMRGDIQFGGGGTPTEETATPTQQAYVPEGPTVGAELVADGPLVNPVTLRSVPGTEDTHLLVDQIGRVYVLEGGELREEPFLDLTDRVLVLEDRPEGFDERGLLGMDFHPDFQENGQFYVRYSSAESQSDGDQIAGPGDRGYPEDYDHIAILSEFQMAGDAMGTATPEGTEMEANATEMEANATEMEANATEMEANATGGNQTGNETQMQAGGDGQLQVDPDSERVLLEVPEPQFNHNGGEVTFGPDGYLYATLGDGGDANDTGLGHVEDWYDENDGGNGQDVTENLLGSVLRIDVDEEGEDRPYSVPDDNPLVGTDAYDEHFAWGLRNPWRASFNDGTLVTADVGQALFEEVDVIENGGNYGWNVREGFHCFNADNALQPLDECPNSAPEEPPYDGQELLDPVLEYPHNYEGSPVGLSITGGYVYPGDQLSGLSGQYVFGDWSQNFAEARGRIFVASSDGIGDATPVAPDGEEMAANDTMADETVANETMANGTGEMDNATAGQEMANETVANETMGNETDGEAAAKTETDTPVPLGEQVDIPQPSEQPWPYEEVLISGGEDGSLNRFISAFGRDDQGNIYVLASRTGRLLSEAGEVWRLVPEGEGEEITQPETPTPDDGAAGNETMGNETMGNETMAENETTAGNETVAENETGE